MDSQQPESINLSKDGYSTLQRGAERLGRSFVSPPDGENCISVKPWVIDMIAADPGVRALVEHCQLQVEIGLYEPEATSGAAAALRLWEQGDE